MKDGGNQDRAVDRAENRAGNGRTGRTGRVPRPADGVAFVFLETLGAFGAGHVGWGFTLSISPARYFYGSTQNSGSPLVPPGWDNGYFEAEGSWDDMMNTMRDLRYNNYKR